MDSVIDRQWFCPWCEWQGFDRGQAIRDHCNLAHPAEFAELTLFVRQVD